MLRTFIAGVCLQFASSCQSALPGPTIAKHPARAFVEVPYPPPAALVEVVPDAPDDSVWVDGHWVWRGSYYVWQRGGWSRPPPGVSYATWQSVLTRDGRLLFAPGAWYDTSSRQVTAPRVIAEARTPPNQLTPETSAPR